MPSLPRGSAKKPRLMHFMNMRRLKMGLSTVLGLKKQGFFIPYRYADSPSPLADRTHYPAILAHMQKSIKAQTRFLEEMSVYADVFSSFGKVYSLKSFDIPEASLKARGKPIVNLLPFSEGEKIATFLTLPVNENDWSNYLVVFTTKQGMIRKNKLIDVAKSGKRDLRGTGKLSIKLINNDKLISVKIANDNQDILLSTSDGKCLRFHLDKLRLTSGLNSKGNRGIKLEKNNFLISQAVLNHSLININIRNEYL